MVNVKNVCSGCVTHGLNTRLSAFGAGMTGASSVLSRLSVVNDPALNQQSCYITHCWIRSSSTTTTTTATQPSHTNVKIRRDPQNWKEEPPVPPAFHHPECTKPTSHLPRLAFSLAHHYHHRLLHHCCHFLFLITRTLGFVLTSLRVHFSSPCSVFSPPRVSLLGARLGLPPVELITN